MSDNPIFFRDMGRGNGKLWPLVPLVPIMLYLSPMAVPNYWPQKKRRPAVPPPVALVEQVNDE